MLTHELRHRHSWLAWDWEKIKFSDIEWFTSSSKYCLATTTTWWNPINWNTFSTNDPWMSKTNWQVTITDSWLYMIVTNSYQTNLWTIAWISLKINWTEVATNFIQNYYLSSYRETFPLTYIANLNTGDYITVWTFWSIYNLSSTYLQVVKI